jgi:hypothetical protein
VRTSFRTTGSQQGPYASQLKLRHAMPKDSSSVAAAVNNVQVALVHCGVFIVLAGIPCCILTIFEACVF